MRTSCFFCPTREPNGDSSKYTLATIHDYTKWNVLSWTYKKTESKTRGNEKASIWKTFNQESSNSDSSAINETANSISVVPFNIWSFHEVDVRDHGNGLRSNWSRQNVVQRSVVMEFRCAEHEFDVHTHKSIKTKSLSVKSWRKDMEEFGNES